MSEATVTSCANNIDEPIAEETDRSFRIKGQGLKVSDLLKGTEFELDKPPEEEKSSEDSSDCYWWSREQMRNYLSHNIEDVLVPHDEKITDMTHLQDNVYKRILRDGTGQPVTEQCAISYHYNAYFDGLDEPFDSTILRNKPARNRLDTDGILPGLFIGLLTMREGEKAEILVPPEMGYGELGCLPRIPPNASILYVVEILRVFPEGTLSSCLMQPEEEQTAMPIDEVLELCDKERVSGNSYFRDNRIRDALARYNRAINFLERRLYANKAEQQKANGVLYKLYPNAAICYLRLKKIAPAMTNCRKALEIDPHNTKALYNYGRAKYLNCEYEEARKYFMKVKEIRPNDRTLVEAFKKLDQKIAKNLESEKILCQKMAKAFF